MRSSVRITEHLANSNGRRVRWALPTCETSARFGGQCPPYAVLRHTSHDAGYDPDHLGIAAVDWLHCRIRRLKPNAIGLGVPILQRGFALIRNGDDDIALVSGAGAAADDDVTIGNLGLDHRIALDAQRELILALREPIFEVESVGLLDGFAKIARR